mmetsp:Transcript_54144/g.118071  ORF Transcript_54144/g.118071 Transcript_54144/m.118071 type:complete len:310 (+) Transcript_54144:334-1263(+)
MAVALARAAMIAASFIRAASAAPEKPTVRFATRPRSTPSERGFFCVCTCRMSNLPRTSGRSTRTRRSKRPGRRRAGSSRSARLVAASTITPDAPPKPSISTSIWLSVWSRSSERPEPVAVRVPPTESISSMKTTHGAFSRARSNRLRTRDAPTPTYISTKSEPAMAIKSTPASLATARASRVLPVPGGPSRRQPRGTRAPSSSNRVALVRKSTISISSAFAPSQPATLLKLATSSGGSSSTEVPACMKPRTRISVCPSMRPTRIVGSKLTTAMIASPIVCRCCSAGSSNGGGASPCLTPLLSSSSSSSD